ncbi:hypothetical protein SLS62_003679 [Diatrype stigma]|uniref:N-acetyltransferase ESCO zinc-finger domain-containing protein n=1 Tax=Diatrype stigma TaxID=117547 RepID=A0AAN9YR79_9PEZI
MDPIQKAPSDLGEIRREVSKKPDRIKRTTLSDSGEPPLKRRRTDEAADDARLLESSRHSFLETNGSQPSLPPSHAPPNPKRGTILNYFKVVSPSSNNTKSSSTEPSSCGIEPTSTPPSSPPRRADVKPKKRRRLTTRVIPKHLDDSDAGGNEEDPDVATSEADLPPVQPQRQRKAAAGVLTGTSTDTLNRPATPSQQRSEAGKRGKSKDPNPKPATIQTTLSLSMSDQGFTECKECGMLYNPYHEKDAKFHARRHAAMLKAKAKEGSETP